MADLPQPFFDPSQYPGYLDAQRKQQIAQMLMSGLQQANQTPADWNSMKVVPKRGALQNMSVLADALLAGKGMNDTNRATAQYMQGLYGGGGQQQAPAGPPTGPGPGIVSPDAPPGGGLVPQDAAPPSPQNPLIPPGMSRQQATMIAAMPGGMDALTKVMAANFTPLEISRQIRAAGIDPNSAHGQSIQQAILAKQTTNIQDVKPGSTLFDVNARNPLFTGPEQGALTTWGPNGPVQTQIPGAEAAAQNMAAAKTAGAEGQKPIKLGTDENGKDIYGFASPPGPTATPGAPQPAPKGPAPINATAPGATASPATKAGQESGAKAGQDYAGELAKNATGATEVRRSLSEMRNLASQASPDAANASKMKLGAVLIAAGMDPAKASSMLGVDPGVLQAAAKQNATLAVNSIHAMTSRGTNFDLDTFVKNNPNLNMADPSGFNRVVDYMDNKASQEIAKQKDFAQWKRGVSPDEWETGHTAHWLETQNAAINKGESNSANPNAGPKAFTTEAAAQAAAAAGQLKPGDRIKIGNQTGTWR
jgi:hypothetical protein